VQLKEKLLSPATLMLTSSLPLTLLDPDQVPVAVQLVALVVDQVMVTEVLSTTEAEEDERLIVGVAAAGLGVGVASPPPPPHAARKISNEHLNNNFTASN
tara:strand:+ start:132 stop:431 length:300 start_codon:yes stop_codon:yes gene_type:complete